MSTIVHHGAPLDVLDAIRAHGLTPQPGRHGRGVWATTSWVAAVHYSCALDGSPGAVVSFALLDSDEVHDERGHVRITGSVTPDRLTINTAPTCACHPMGAQS